ncbi:MAG TPA: hypothetical protein VLX68_11015 [Chitinivibrionales bacterium]|nr:hypothetical protein [Chitinivibrionales bacterium]
MKYLCLAVNRLAGLLVLLFALAAGAVAQDLRTPVSSCDTANITLSSRDSVAHDSTLVLMVRVMNKSRRVAEAAVSLIDSASGDTIENWYPLIPPQSSDSTEIFWNTKGAKVGNHTLKAVYSLPQDSVPAIEERKLQVRVKP